MNFDFHNAQSHRVCAASELVLKDEKRFVIIASSLNGEVNAEQILKRVLADYKIAISTSGVTVLWSTPAQFSASGRALLRILNLDGSSLEWGPPLVFTDAPELHQAAERCNAELLGMTD